MRSLPTLVSASIALSVAAATSLAGASPIFPDAIKTDLSLTYDLGTTHCIICHQTNSGGIGTATQPFGQAMRAAGLTLENLPALQTALNTLKTDMTDSDCDGVPDIAQLQAGRDPNTGAYIDGSGRTAPPETGCATSGDFPAFGCGAQLSRAPAPWQGAAALVAALGAALVRSARRRRR